VSSDQWERKRLLGEAAFEGVDEGLDHFREAFGFLDHGPGVFQSRLTEAFADALRDVELGAEFAAGTFAVAEEVDEFRGAVALSTLRDIGWDGKGGPLHLIAQGEVLGLSKRDMDVHRKVTSPLPDFQILECFNVAHS
jgi:hypothetical protein